MKNSKFQEDVKFGELVWDLIMTERVREMRGFGIVLASRIFIEIIEPKGYSQCEFRVM
jgi:hypothetical protein